MRLSCRQFPWRKVSRPPGVAVDRLTPPLVATFRATRADSDNLTVSTSGTVPQSGARFVRKDPMSMFVR
jgi:hypothetical protein